VLPLDSPADAAFRAEVRAWLEAHAQPRGPRGNWSDGPREHTPQAEAQHFARCRAWQRTRYAGGWAAIPWPRRWGGRDGTALQQMIYSEEEARFDVTTGFLAASIALLGPALLVHGNDAQRERFLGPMLRADETWCQLFSEPAAGSDLARLATRAERRDDRFVVNGQKVWTTSAQHCDWGFLLARTNPDAPKHRGISFLLVDMRTPGVEVRPLRTMARTTHFNEVFFTDVEVPVQNVVGEIDGGWSVARTTLAHEAVMIGSGVQRDDRAENLIELARERARLDDPRVRQELATAWINQRILGLFRERLGEALRAGRPPDLDGSALKLFWSESRIQRAELGLALLGPEALLDGPDAFRHGFWQAAVLSRAMGSVGGGTHEVHRNNLGERALGLPREPRGDAELSFRELVAREAQLRG
jgi:acyl-CoA dehydrogenase